MPLYYGRSKEEVGDIMHKDFITGKPEPMIGVFWKDELIWPSVSKYIFHATNHDNVWVSCDDPIVVNASHQYVTIHVKSCSRFYRDRYPYKVTCISNWCTLDDNFMENTFYPNKNEVGKENEEDSSFLISIKPNYGRQSRSTYILLQQLDDYHKDEEVSKEFWLKEYDGTDNIDSHKIGETFSGNQLIIRITQTADKPIEKPDYSIPKIRWYDSETFENIIESYGTDDDPKVNMNGGIQNVWVSIEGKALMSSGTYSAYYYGDNGETLDFSNFFFSDNSAIDSITDVQYFGYGQWQATIHWNKNMPKGNDLKTYIKNLRLSNDSVSRLGGNLTMLWSIYKGGTSSTKQVEMSIRLNGYSSKNGQISIYQSGGSISEKTNQEKCTVSISGNGQGWCKLNSGISFTSNQDYAQQLIVSPQSSVSKMYIEDLAVDNDVNHIKYDQTSGNISFSIYKKDGVYEERKTYAYVNCNNVTESIDIKQNGDENGIAKTVDNELLNASSISIVEDNPKDDSYWTNFIKYSNIRYDAWMEQWYVSFSCDSNLKKTVGKTINIISYPDAVPSKANDATISWTVSSGEVNSNWRHSRLHAIIKNYHCDEYYDISQAPSEDAQKITYYDDEAKNVVISNLTDSTSNNSLKSISNHVCTGTISIKENKTKKDGSIAFVVPTEVSEWSFSDIDVDSNASFFFKVYGKNGYESTKRNISIRLSKSGLTSKDISIAQDPADYILSDDNVPCDDLAISEFKLNEESQGTLLKTSSLISKDQGLYKINVNVSPNISPDRYIVSLNVGNKVNMEQTWSYNSLQSITSPTFEISPKYDNNHTVVLASWKNDGSPKTRSVSLSIKSISGKKFDATWKNVPYSGEGYSHNTLNKDYSLSLNPSSWIHLEDNVIVSDSNSTNQNRSNSLIVKYNTSDNASKSITVPIYQSIKTREADYIFWTNVGNNAKLSIDPINGNPGSCTFYVTSYDDETNQTLGFSMNNKDLDGLLIQKTKSDGIFEVKVVPTSINNGTSTKIWTINIVQEQSGKKLSLSIVQPNYILNVSNSTVNVDVSHSSTIYVESSSNGNATDFRYETDSDWLLVSNVDFNRKMITCLTINDSPNDREGFIKITQNGSEITRYVKVMNKCWKNPEFDSSDINLYKKGDYENRLFYSQESNINIIPSISTIYTSAGSSISTAIKENGSQYAFNAISNETLDGDIPKIAKYLIKNKNQSIGQINVVLHAFNLKATSESEESITWYASPNKNEIWSLYYVNSTMDKSSIEYEVKLSSDSIPLYIERNESCISIIPTSSNNTDRRIEYVGRIIQEKSGKELNVRIIQLPKIEDEQIYY